MHVHRGIVQKAMLHVVAGTCSSPAVVVCKGGPVAVSEESAGGGEGMAVQEKTRAG